MQPKWFEHSFRRNLVDMHIADSDPRFMRAYDPVHYVDNLVRAGIDTAIVYAGNCLGLCFWPTRVGQMHRGLDGRDILREVTDECRRRDLKVVVYFNIWSRWAYDTHPEWRYVNAAGKGHLVETQGQRYGLCCPNTAYGPYVLQQVADLAEHYAMDGFWVDMIGWFAGPCFCAACQARYRDETGAAFPAQVDWLDPAFDQFQTRREAWFAGFARDIRATLHRHQPAASITFQAASWSLGWYLGVSPELFAQSDYLAGDFYGDPIEQSYVCKLLEALATHRPVEFMTSRCPTLAEHTTMKPRELLEAQAFAAMANNAAFVFIDAMNPDGTVEPAPYVVMGDILARTRVYEQYLGPHLTRLADVGLYTDLRSLASLQDAGTPLADASPRRVPARSLQRVAGTLVRHHLTYDVVTRRQLGELARFRVVILPDAFRLDVEEAAALREYVAAGGRLYVSGDTSFAAGNGDFLLGDMLGVRRAGRTAWEITFLSPTPGHSELSPATAGAPLELNEGMTLVEADADAEVLAHLALPYTPPFDAQVYASAISNPPGPASEHPALVRHAYGQGVTLYCAGRLESAPHEAHATVFARLIRGLLNGPDLVQTDAPRAVEIMVYADDHARCLLVCLLNFQRDLPNIPVHHIEVSVGLGGRPASTVTCLPDDVPVPARVQGDRVAFTVERLETFAMYRIA